MLTRTTRTAGWWSWKRGHKPDLNLLSSDSHFSLAKGRAKCQHSPSQSFSRPIESFKFPSRGVNNLRAEAFYEWRRFSGGSCAGCRKTPQIICWLHRIDRFRSDGERAGELLDARL